MNQDEHIINNVERFSGFQSEYNRYRPTPPHLVVELLTKYLGTTPLCIVDLGCGTGLSTFIWKDSTNQIIGVEPNDDMRRQAEEMLSQSDDADHISFVKGYSNQLDIASGTIDIVTCSQSFHWMDPISTLNVVNRILRAGGIFAAYDCDWPPTVNWEIEDKYIRLIDMVEAFILKHAKKETLVKKWAKDEHLKNLKDSKAFRFTKEIVFHSREKCDSERYFGLAISQGGLQTILKSGWTDLNEDIEQFRKIVENYFGQQTLDIVFSYRMRIGIK